MKINLKRFSALSLSLLLSSSLFAGGLDNSGNKEIVLKIAETADIHGNFFSYDYINACPMAGGLTRVSTYMNELRAENGESNCLLLENGDLLQGQPCVYYGNFLEREENLLASAVLNYIKYDVVNFGNHDVEAGHDVYDRWVKDCDAPVLGANMIDNATGLPYAKPYSIIEREGVKIAILGMVTAQVPLWLPEKLWSGITFEPMMEQAKIWVPFIQKTEKPDIMIGLFHQGVDSHAEGDSYEASCTEIAKQVPGFDIIFMGHDHRAYCDTVINEVDGKEVWLLNAGGGGDNVVVATLNCSISECGKLDSFEIDGELVDMAGYEPDPAMLEFFSAREDNVKEFINAQVGELKEDVKAIDYYFGNSDMGNILHNTQFNITDAEISIVAPLSVNAVIKAGPVYMRDIFKLYKYENMINTMELTGREIKGCLEMGYGTLCEVMSSSKDHIILMREGHDGSLQMKNYTSSMVTAAGITYEVDITKATGERVNIISTSKGEPFDLDKTYIVAVNSYIGSGAGGLLTVGADIEHSALPERIITTTTLDFRYHIADYIKLSAEQGKIEPVSNWKFVPEKLAKPAIKRDYKILDK